MCVCASCFVVSFSKADSFPPLSPGCVCDSTLVCRLFKAPPCLTSDLLSRKARAAPHTKVVCRSHSLVPSLTP